MNRVRSALEREGFSEGHSRNPNHRHKLHHGKFQLDKGKKILNCYPQGDEAWSVQLPDVLYSMNYISVTQQAFI